MSYEGFFKMAAVTMTSLSDRYEKRPGTRLVMSYALRLEPGRLHAAVSSNSITLFVGAKAYTSKERNSSGSFALLQSQVRTTSGLFSILANSCRTTPFACTKGEHYCVHCSSCTARLNSLWHWSASLI